MEGGGVVVMVMVVTSTDVYAYGTDWISAS